MNRALALLLACAALATLAACEPKPQGPKAAAAATPSTLAFTSPAWASLLRQS